MTAYRFTYSVDEARRLIVFRVAGAVPSTLLNDKFVCAYRAIPNHWEYNRLIDYRRYTGLMDFADVEDFARKIAYLNRDRPRHYKVAVVTTDPFEQARPATFRHLFPEDVKTFASMDDALDWLNQAPASDRQAG
jgi:hypothetical protein